MSAYPADIKSLKNTIKALGKQEQKWESAETKLHKLDRLSTKYDAAQANCNNQRSNYKN